MALQLIAVPIGNPGDITLRAIEALKAATVVIGEERKEVSKLLKMLSIEGKSLELLNEHSKDNDVNELLAMCRTQDVALVSDCGTPGFCDPGARLVAACRAEGIRVSPVPGASSLMCLLSVTGFDMKQFLFRGFLPADRDDRTRALRDLDRESRAIVLMDTPYRLGRLVEELAERWPKRRAVLGMDFTQATEEILEGELGSFPAKVGERKAEFILVLTAQQAPEMKQRPNQPAARTASTGSRPGQKPTGNPVSRPGQPSGKSNGKPSAADRELRRKQIQRRRK
jgi:16S rRNA (cytidine1402-2'-O)-methyltransferase